MSPAAALASAFAMKSLTFRSDAGPFMHEPVARQTGPQYQGDSVLSVSLSAPVRTACNDADSRDDRGPRRSKLNGHERTRGNSGNRALANRRIIAAQGDRLGGKWRHCSYRGAD